MSKQGLIKDKGYCNCVFGIISLRRYSVFILWIHLPWQRLDSLRISRCVGNMRLSLAVKRKKADKSKSEALNGFLGSGLGYGDAYAGYPWIG